ncbi:hypothetical protein [Caviibacterium pharyngocola]|uniref:Uncharacterized protein n=1 Tax=Caviibacterium pharyngocola TaxID=28159 RepID=A0A2M8RT82_9PAST|nr:hypothetical protein [Caviibacterium pharyngocola]PJG82094.1 hypothetical protein CVP04_10590 [Caviibacterium pharyngocola]
MTTQHIEQIWIIESAESENFDPPEDYSFETLSYTAFEQKISRTNEKKPLLTFAVLYDIAELKKLASLKANLQFFYLINLTEQNLSRQDADFADGIIHLKETQLNKLHQMIAAATINPGLINIDLSDLQKTIDKKSVRFYSQDFHYANLEQELNHFLSQDKTDLSAAQFILVMIVSGMSFSLEQFSLIGELIGEQAPKAKIMIGTGLEFEGYDESLSLQLLIDA